MPIISLRNFVSVLIGAAAISITLLRLDFPFYLYIPGILARITRPTAPYKEINWIQSHDISEPKHPNIIFIIADDLGYNDLSFGSAGVATPNIDSIGSNGVSFLNAYAGHATCSPARASIMTGRFATRFGFEFTAAPASITMFVVQSLTNSSDSHQAVFHYDKYKDVPPMNEMVVPTSEIMISNVLEAQNYSTVYVGKWHLGAAKGTTPLERGFKETLAIMNGAAMFIDRGHPSVVNARVGGSFDDFHWANLRPIVSFNNEQIFTPNEHMTDYLASEAVKVIKAKGRSPYFMVLAFNAPHIPLQAMREDYESPEVANITDHTRRVYAAMIKGLDRGVGRVLQAVEESGRAEDTIIIFTSDNGGSGTVNLPEINSPFRGWKTTFFEGGLRVPFFLSWPRKIPKGSVYDKPVGHVDMFATAAEAAGVDMKSLSRDTGKTFDGVNLASLVSEFKQPLHRISNRIEDGLMPSLVVHKQEAASTLPHPSLYWRSGHYIAVRNGNMKIQTSDRPDTVWLFDLAHDPTERFNLAGVNQWSPLRVVAAKALQICADNKACAAALSPATLCEDDLNVGRLFNATFLDWDWLHAVSISSRDVSGTPTITRLLCMGVQVLLQSAQQREPLWPSLAEMAVPIDHTGYYIPPGSEWVNWAN